MCKEINDQLLIIEEGHFEKWNGLDGHWTKEQLEKTGNDIFQQGEYMLDGMAFFRFDILLKKQKQKLQCFAESNGHISLLRLEDAVMAISLKELTLLWGPPESRRSLNYPDRYAHAFQWIYASKGITLYVPDEVSSDVLQLTCAALYPKTSVKAYLEHLGGMESIIYFNDL